MNRLCLLLLFLLASAARADSWPAAVPMGVISSDGKVAARILPGNSIGDVLGFAGSGKGQTAQAIVYRLGPDDKYSRALAWSLLNPVAPVFAALSDAGELVTLDNWHNMGHGKIVVVYGADGKIRRSYELSEIYSTDERRRFQQSVSSIWWRCNAQPALHGPTGKLSVHDRIGNVLEVNLASGELKRLGTHPGC
jgi:hypothetical protein